MSKMSRFTFACAAALVTWTTSAASYAGTCAPPDAAERAKKEVSGGSFVKLPEMEKRTVIGSWLRVSGHTTSIEKVGNRYFMVSRTRFCDTGTQGWPLTKSKGQYLDENGDRYEVLANGRLGVFEGRRMVDSYKFNAGVWPE
jgi:hypothetical protein